MGGGVHVHGGLAERATDVANPDLPVPSRRALLKASLIAAAGAIGWGAGKAIDGAGTGAAVAAGTMSLEGLRMRHASGGPGELAGHGDLLGPGGSEGSFSSTRLATSPSAGSANNGAELHTFNLSDGSIFGLGTPSARGEGVAVFAILGGTGRFAGASGTYEAEQSPRERGGDGTASFKFNFAQPQTK